MITFIRHAQSRFNCGEDKGPDVALSKLGMQQAGQIFGNYDLVICSNMLRTKQTLLNSRITADNVMYTDLCREKKNCVSDLKLKEVPGFKQPETDEEFRSRAIKFRDMIYCLIKTYPNIVVISHGLFIKELTGIKLDNAMGTTIILQ